MTCITDTEEQQEHLQCWKAEFNWATATDKDNKVNNTFISSPTLFLPLSQIRPNQEGTMDVYIIVSKCLHFHPSRLQHIPDVFKYNFRVVWTGDQILAKEVFLFNENIILFVWT